MLKLAMQGGIWFSHVSWLSGQVRKFRRMNLCDVGRMRVDMNDIRVPHGLYNEVG